MSAASATAGAGEEEDIKKEELKTRPSKNGSGDARPINKKGRSYEGITKLRNFLRTRRLELSTFVTRLLTVYFAFFYIFPIFGSTNMFYRRALIANAATSAVRLYQRLPQPYTMSKEFFAHLIIEDSCHYLFYSIVFLYFGHISFALIPILLFSQLHACNFMLVMLELIKGPAAKFSGFGSFLYFCTSRTPWVLKLTATAEVGLMGVILLNCFRGTVSVVALFVYYRFLYLRYASKRNHHTRIVFQEMRSAAEAFIAKGCPMLVARMIRMGIAILCKLAPAVPNPSS